MKPRTTRRATNRFLLAILLVIAVLAPLEQLRMVNNRSFHRPGAPDASDLTPPWIAMQGALHGQNPYSDQVTDQIQTVIYGHQLGENKEQLDPQRFAYPVHALVLLAPLAHFSWVSVRLGFLILLPILIGASVLAWLHVTGIKLSATHLVVLLVLTISSWPMMWGLRLQQLTLPIAVLVAAGCFLLKRRWDVVAGILFAMATIKPQLTAPLILWLLLWTLLQRRWRFAASFGTTLLILFALAENLVPGWIPNWLAEASAYAVYTHSMPILQRIFGSAIGLASTAALALWSGYILWKLRRCSSESAEFGLAIALALSMTLSATLSRAGWIYNQVLLIPALLIVIRSRPLKNYAVLARGLTLAMLAWGFVAVEIALVIEKFVDGANVWDALPFANLLLPVATVLALGSHWASREHAAVPEEEKADHQNVLVEVAS